MHSVSVTTGEVAELGNIPMLSAFTMGSISKMAVAMFRSSAWVIAALLLTGCGQRTEVRQKVTLSVETPSGLKAASSVISVTYVPPLLKGPAAGFDQATITRSGEAVVMEVAPGRYLFALLKGLPDPWAVFFPNQGPQDTIEKFKDMIGDTRELTSNQYPWLVTFADLNEPATVVRVDPTNLAAAFGPDYRLVSITLSVTEEPVTNGNVEKILGWLGPYPEPNLSPATGKTSDIPFSRQVAQGDFIRR